MPEFINRFNDAKKKATRASLPITEDWLAAMATSALLSANYFPNNRPAWDGTIPSAQKWTAWHLKFGPLHSAIERELCASSQRGDSFGSAHLDMVAHGISAASPTQTPTGQQPAMPLSSEEIMAQFDGHFINLASAATNSGAALDQLASTSTTQFSDIKSLLTSLKAAALNGSHSAAATTSTTPQTTQEQSKKRIQQLEAAVPNKKASRCLFFSPMDGV